MLGIVQFCADDEYFYCDIDMTMAMKILLHVFFFSDGEVSMQYYGADVIRRTVAGEKVDISSEISIGDGMLTFPGGKAPFPVERLNTFPDELIHLNEDRGPQTPGEGEVDSI